LRWEGAVLTTDVHQHLWPEALIDALRRRSRPPRLVGWTLYLAGEAPYEVRPKDHDVRHRASLDEVDRIAVSLSSPLGIELLPADEANPLLAAWHEGAAALPEPFVAWASVSRHEPDLAALARQLAGGFVGLQVPATEMLTPRAVAELAPALRVAERADRPVLVHPGPVPASPDQMPDWWPAVVDYVAQLQAAWWSWMSAGRALLPQLRVCFVAGGGLAALQRERFLARGGAGVADDPGVFVDTSSHGRLALRALAEVLGPAALVLGSDRPYAPPTDPDIGEAVTAAIRGLNPDRLLGPAGT
jgi:hypothetical protein